jgi:16S rRNA (cytidine1402-2'-O)-methyltransferase
MLYLIATPIGNLGDMTFRAVEALKGCDYVLCEDTRHSGVLMKHYGIEKPLKSFHQFNEKQREDEVVADLKAGKNVCMVSDAGTPGICDPGERLVKRCREERIAVTAVPGPCAWAMALSLSGMDKSKIQFVGFLDQRDVGEWMSYAGTTICYEAPHRIIETLEKIVEIDAKRVVSIMRELTKTFEECLEGSAEEVLGHFRKTPPKGEMVLLIEGCKIDFKQGSEVEHVQALQDQFGLSVAEAIKIAAELRGVPKREVYNIVHQNSSK